MNKQKSQSGFAHLFIVTVILAAVVIGVVGYIVWQNSTNNSANKTKNQQKTSQQETTKKYYISETGVNISFPSFYMVEVNQEENRFGSFKAYDFNRNPFADIHFSELMFSNIDSVKQFYDVANNGEMNLIEGDYLSTENFVALGKAFRTGGGYEYTFGDFSGEKVLKYENISIGGDNWLVATHDYSARKQGYQREYIRFVDGGSTMMSAHIGMSNLDNSSADELFSQFHLTR